MTVTRFRGWAVLCCCLLAAAFAGAQPPAHFEVSIEVEEPLAFLDLIEAGYNISAINGVAATLYVTEEALEALAELDVEIVSATLQTTTDRNPNAVLAPSGYPSYNEVTTALQTVATEFGAGQSEKADLCRLVSLGKSVLGRELWALLITTNPDVEEDEPEFKYISTMHGDEVLGTELSLRFIDLLLNGYGNDADITSLVDNTAIWIVPLMNPDGYELGTRMNANGVDLNRNFPAFPADWAGTIFGGAPLDDTGRQPETRHVMNWSAENSFVLAASIHGGALVVNYPFDDADAGSFNDAPTPDDLLFEEVSSRYAVNNTPMFTNPVPSNAVGGIINGSLWFTISGGMIDWNYRYLACNEVTLELHVDKDPPASQIDQFWADNQNAMLAYLASVHMGVRGVVTDADTGQPVYAAIRVQGNAQPVFTDPDVGDYHRMLLPGEYTLTVSAPGYVTQTIPDVQATEPSARVDVALQSAEGVADINQDGNVDAADVQLVINARFGVHVPYNTDVDNNGEVNSLDIQIVVAALLTK